MERYTYQSLGQGSNNIRLFQLLPGSSEEHIWGKILNNSIKPDRNHGLYEALSYVWGEAITPQRILIQGTKNMQPCYLDITPNLYAALRQMRDPDLPRMLWIDAICINQEDVHERASQVQIMSLIYSYAASVTVWLGEEADNSSKMFDMLRQAAVPYSERDLFLQHFVKLLERSWFGRIWVLQEVAAARYTFVTCGEKELTGSTFVHGMRNLCGHFRHSHSHLVDPINSVMRLMDKELMVKARDELSSKMSGDGSGASWSLAFASLAELLERFHMHDATDRRDKIYALLGLSNDSHLSPMLRVDYAKPWPVLLHDIVAQFLGPAVSINTWEEKEEAVIIGSGCPLGTFYSKPDGRLAFRSPSFTGVRSFTTHWHPDLPISGYDDIIQDGDILCVLEGAQYPSIVRRHKDHFMLVKIALTNPPIVNVTTAPGIRSTSALHWKAFSQFITKFPRHFVLIWDWSTDQKYREERCTRMLKDVEDTGKTSTTVHSRMFNMTRIMEDLEDKHSLILLLGEYATSEKPDWLMRYHNMLQYVCEYWVEYGQLKVYVSQLRWSNWLMSSQYTGDPTSGFWLAEGILNLDLFDLLPSAGRARSIEEKMTHLTTQQVWKFGEDGLLPVLDTLAQGSIQLAATVSTTHGHINSAALIRQRIFYMIFSGQSTKSLHPKAMLDMLDSNPDLFEATKLSLTIFSEISGMKGELTTYILQRLRRPMSRPNWELLTFLLEQSSADTNSIIAIFEEAQVWSLRGDKEHYETCSKFLMPCAAVLCKYIINTDLCIALIEQWETEVGDTSSVLEFLCNTYTSSFKYMVGSSEGELVRSSEYPRSKSAQVDLARGCLLAAIRIVAPWIDNSLEETDLYSQETDVPRILASLQLLWSSKEQTSAPSNAPLSRVEM